MGPNLVRKAAQRIRCLCGPSESDSEKDTAWPAKRTNTAPRWAVGLARHLLERESHDLPSGLVWRSTVSYLRTVIVDSLDWTEHENRKCDEEGLEGRGSVAATVVPEEAEWRLGFAIKDLPEGSGKDRRTASFVYLNCLPFP